MSATKTRETGRAATAPEEPPAPQTLLAAGGVLPADAADGAGERAVELTARAYRHPALTDRVVVRLAPRELGAAEDLAAGYLGLEPHGSPETVGIGLRRPLGFPEWVLVHHPQDGPEALGLVPELERLAQQAKSKPKAALTACQKLAEQLAAARPHFLPTFCEQAGRMFLAVDNPGYAAQLFGRARQAEAEHGLPLDEERLDTVFLEFAVAGAIPVKALAGYARELSGRVAPAQALRRFSRLCVQRTAHGMAPSARMGTELRRLAKAAGEDGRHAEVGYVTALLELPATLRAATGWWKGHRTALVRLAREDGEVRRRLLELMPQCNDRELPALWLELLEETGATAGLVDAAPESGPPADGSAGWLGRFLAFHRGGYRTEPLPALYRLVERMAGRLREEAAASATPLPVPHDVNLLDLLLSLGIPVAVPQRHDRLNLRSWAHGGERRDLLALAADPRFGPAFRSGADACASDAAALRALAESPGGRPLLTEWVAGVAERSTAAGLPELPRALATVSGLPGEVLALAEHEVRRVTATDLAPLVARTLRAGILDELCWPAWERAAAELVAPDDVDDLQIAEAWPHLIVAGPAQVRVLAADSTVLTHDLRIPPGDRNRWRDPGFHYVDGSLLVSWGSRELDGATRGYWHTDPGRLLRLEGADSSRGSRMTWYDGSDDASTLPLPGGGRATGAGILHAGDSVLPREKPLISDGVSSWVWCREEDAPEGTGWYAWDPATGETGARGGPRFLDAAADRSHWLLPAAEPGELLGWRSVRLEDGSWLGEDASGRTVTVPAGGGRPDAALVFPGDGRPRAVVATSYRVTLFGPDGEATATARSDDAPGAFASAWPILPPRRYWHCLRPRDPEGSSALRAVGRDTAAALLDAAAALPEKELPDAVRRLLPGIGDPALAAGVAGVVRHAAEQRKVLERTAARLETALVQRPETPDGPSDARICTALNGLGLCTGHDATRHGSESGVMALLEAVHREAVPPEGVRWRTHLDGPALPGGRLDRGPLLRSVEALAFRALTAVTPDDDRRSLRALLDAAATAGLGAGGDASPWRQAELRLDSAEVEGHPGAWRGGAGLLPLAGGATLAVLRGHLGSDGAEFTALCHDPSGRFEIPPPYRVPGLEPTGAAWPQGRLSTFLTLLAERGAVPWSPGAAEEFARLTGVTPTAARLVLAGLPRVDAGGGRDFLPAEVRGALGVKVAEAAFARDGLREVSGATRRRVVAALLPEDPERLWSEGPDAAAAAAVWNAEVGRRAAVPEALLLEATRAVRSEWAPRGALPAVLDPAADPRFSRDLRWTVRGDRAVPSDAGAAGFDAAALTGAVGLTAWLAHRLPAGDPVRAALPAALAAVRERLDHPGLLLDIGRYVDLHAFREAAGSPDEVTDTHERYGAVLMATHDSQPSPAIRPALLSGGPGDDPYLAALRSDPRHRFPVEAALEVARSERFAALLADPGDPAAGERGADGTWWPQDPSRSVPDLVAEVASERGLGADAAAVYLMVLAMPDPTDRHTARWTGWKPARMKAARAELASSPLVTEASRARAGRSLFLPGAWEDQRSPLLPLERWKLPLFAPLSEAGGAALDVLVPARPAAALYRAAWQRVREGDVPRLADLPLPRGGRR